MCGPGGEAGDPGKAAAEKEAPPGPGKGRGSWSGDKGGATPRALFQGQFTVPIVGLSSG